MVGDIELDDVAAQLVQARGLRADLHALLHLGRAGGRISLASLDLDQAHATGTEGVEGVRGAQPGYRDAGFGGRAHHRRAPGDRDGLPVDRQGDRLPDPDRGTHVLQFQPYVVHFALIVLE
jgi:hypothetical protein